MSKIKESHGPKLEGIVPPLITPLKTHDELDHAGLERLLEHVVAGGVKGIFILGTTGEGPALSYRLRRELIKQVCRQIRSRVPVLVGITDPSYAEAVALAGQAADAGAQAVVASAPYYMPPQQMELYDYLRRLTGQLPLPLMLYNIPAMTKVTFELEMIKRLTDLKRIVGIKDSSGDLKYFKRLVALKRQRPDWSIFVGLEHQLAVATRLGADGGVNAGANYEPSLFVELHEAVKAGDRLRERTLQRRLLHLGKIFRVGTSAAGVVQGLKCACASRGLCKEVLAPPFAPLEAAQRKQVLRILKTLPGPGSAD